MATYIPKSQRESTSKQQPKKSNTNANTTSNDLQFSTPFLDSHVHIDFVLERMKYKIDDFQLLKSTHFGSLFSGCINVCCFPDTYDNQERLIGQPSLYSTFGIHPHSADKYDDAMEARIMKNMEHPSVVAWGECGLDYFKSEVKAEIQQEAFVRQMKGSLAVKKPLVVHARDASDDTVRLMTEVMPQDSKIHLHCFTGDDLAFANKMLSSFPNLKIGFTGAITFKSAAKLRDIVKTVPLNRIVLETDGPFMAPEPNRGVPAHSGMIPLVGNCVAKLHGVSLDEVLKQTYINTNDIYGCFPVVNK